MNFLVEHNEIYLLDQKNNKIAYVLFPTFKDNIVVVTKTFVSDELRGQGIASKLMNELYNELKRSGRKAILKCSYAITWFDKNFDKKDVIW